MRRASFIASTAAIGAFAFTRRVRAGLTQSEIDPSMTAQSASLRVLLGRGQAIAVARDRFTFNGRAYRGSYIAAADGSIVNLVDIESYLYGVVTHEMPPSWPMAALSAQAICARTFVLRRSNPRREYDVVPSELDQVYRGIAGETPNGNASVDATLGMVLRYGDAFAYSLYSSCCGGHTEASADAWSGPPVAYLMGVPCEYCTASPHYHWNATLPTATIDRACATQLNTLGQFAALRIAQTDSSGRARMFELVAQRGSAFVKGSTFRLQVGPRILPSTLITSITSDPAPTPLAIALAGRGLGHGVGLCQWGARGMALGGQTTSDILALYFPGTDITHA